MVNLDCKTNIVPSDNMPSRSPRPSSSTKLSVLVPPPPLHVQDLSPASDTACTTYEHYLRLPEIRELWNKVEFPEWKNEAVLKPALHALEFTFRFVSIVLSDPRPYANRREWMRRLESLTTSQIELISLFCEEDTCTAPIVNIGESGGVLTREGSSAEVWKLSEGEDATVLVSQISEESLLPRLATWRKSENLAQKIQYTIECNMMRCPYTLGLGEPNLSGKPSLNYDAVCKPSNLHSLTKTPPDQSNVNNYENRTLFTTHQILESWIHVAQKLLIRIESDINSNGFATASTNCYILEQIWKLLAKIEDLHLLMDPDDFLRLKNQLDIKTTCETDSLCFRSRSLTEITKLSKNLRHKVPYILDVEVDPMGGPIVQETALKLYRKKDNGVKIHLLQGLQAVEAAVKKFYYSYKQLLVVVMGSVEAKGNLASVTVDLNDSLGRIFLEPTYYPSLDGAKTFLGDYWSHEGRGR
ncbi:putative nematode resistance protein-like HSPRO1 [Helianthus annuus]|nr:putative nematode resistance protein-like HSPRO1 [Helianthus annuus]KAJ0842299.1 putative nematode resistance protein-like HSPRO1 [Helianthus annuus]KAJ0855912.1 putative nematode resistance protein-like HSPRO1 [Helianthus annuus]